MVDVTVTNTASSPVMTSTEISNWDDQWKCHHEYLNEQNSQSATAMLIIGGLLLPKYKDRYNDSQDRLQDISIRQQNVALCLKDHFIDIAHPQIVKSLNDSLNMEITSTDINCSEFDGKSKEVLDSTKAWGLSYSSRYNVCYEIGCDNELELYSAMGAVDTSYARQQFLKRRAERRRQLKRSMVQKSHSASSQGTGPIFDLFQSASGIYSQLFQTAQTQLAGAFQTFGAGLSGGGASRFFGG